MSLRAKSLRHTPDLERIKSLPRRTLRKATAAKHAAAWTAKLALRRGADLRPWQGQALHEAFRVGGLLASLPVGQGKTIVCELLPVVLDSTRAVLIIPANLKEKTFADRRALAGVWRTASPPPRIVTREELALDANAYLLQTINPDLIIIDEADELANWKASAVVRIDRFIAAKRKAGGFKAVRVVAMTGTLTRNSILGYWHILKWCLGDMAPVPTARQEAELWALALDNKSPRDGFRPSPGPLGSTLEQAREWYLDRLDHTPGVMLVDEDSAEGIPLTVRIRLTPECPKIDAAFDTLRTMWESPSGEPVTDALSMHRIEGQAGCGLYSYWDPKPPDEWLEARRELAGFIRARISETRHAIKPLDTDAQVIRRHKDHPIVVEWQRVRKMFDPRKASHTRWLSTVTLRRVARWIAAQEKAGRVCIVWCGSVEFGMRLAETAGVPYYGREGKEAKTGRDLHAADARKSMVCSWHANKRGFNLQDWRTHAIVYPPQSAKYLEQIFGRSHRSPKPGVALHLTPVEFTLFLTSGGTLDAFRKAVGEAGFAKGTTKSTQKILRATIEHPPEMPEGLRWVTTTDED
jgi:hypothetical protein